MRATRRLSDAAEAMPLVLRYPAPSTFASVVIGLAAGLVMFIVPVRPGDRPMFVGLGLLVFAASAFLGWYMTVRVVVDDSGVERRRLGVRPARLAWGDVARVATFLGQSVRLVGREGGPTIGVSSSFVGFPAFLDLLEARPEYDGWLRGEAGPEEVVPGASVRFARPGPILGAAVASAGLWTLAIVFLLSPGMFQGWRGDGPRALLFNLAFIDHPALGRVLVVALAVAATVSMLVAWHTLRIEYDVIELESLTRTRTIPFDEVAGLDLKVDRGQSGSRVHSFDHALTLRLADGRSVSLLRGEAGKRARVAIERALETWRARGGSSARRESAGSPSGPSGGPARRGGAA